MTLLGIGASFAGVAGCRRGDDARRATDTSRPTTATTSGVAPVVDDYGDTVRPTVRPTRIISLNPTTTEILFAIGAGSRVIGRSHWDEWPDSARLIPDLGNGIRPNVEAIVSARPDLVIVYASVDNQPVVHRLHAAGIATLSLKTDLIADFDRTTRMLGRVLGDTMRATRVADSVHATLDRVRAATASLPHPRVVWPFMYRPVMVVGGGSYLTELLAIAGATNIYGSLKEPSPIVTLEDVVRHNPDYVLRSADAAQTGPIDAAWRAVPAVRAGHVLVTRTDLVGRPSVQLGMAAVHLATVLHPGIVLQ